MAGEWVLVTGGNGFVAKHCILELFERGYRVRATVRSLARAAALRAVLQQHCPAAGSLELVEADLLQDAGWAEAVAGCDYVLHVASPVRFVLPKDEDEIIRPAREGSLRVLRAAHSGGVKRVVLTSSLAAVCDGYPQREQPFDENDWSRLDKLDTYSKSKTLAERAAWDYIHGHENVRGMQLAVINPGFIFGPLLDTSYNASSDPIRKILARELPGLPHMMMTIVDVRDVASAHLAAMTTPAAAGQRFCCTTTSLWMREIALVLKGAGYRVPSAGLPNLLVRLAGLFDPEVKASLPGLDLRYHVSTERIQRVLAWTPRPAEEAILALAQSMVQLGLVRA